MREIFVSRLLNVPINPTLFPPTLLLERFDREEMAIRSLCLLTD